MKTVQQWLRETDARDVVDQFLAAYPPETWRVKAAGISVSEAYKRMEDKLYAFIEKLRSLMPEAQGDMVFFAYPSGKGESSECLTTMIDRSELTDSQEKYYGWMTTNRAALMGYSIADTDYTTRHIPEVLAAILNEASFMGYEDAEFDKNCEELFASLEKSMEDIENGRVISADKLWEHLGLERPAKDEDEEMLDKKVKVAQIEYENYCRTREYEKVRQLLLAQQE